MSWAYQEKIWNHAFRYEVAISGLRGYVLRESLTRSSETVRRVVMVVPEIQSRGLCF